MRKRQGPAAFLSYVHEDDKDGRITALRERLCDEVQMQVGTEFPIFQDRKDILWGDNWRARIEGSLDEVTFLIPVITPRFFNSRHCRAELQRFLEREKQLGRNDLILPIYFVDTPHLNDEEERAADDLAEVIASRQYADWRELRLEHQTNPQVARTLAHLARQIRDAIPRVRPAKKADAPPTPVPPESQSPAPPAAEVIEQSAQRPTPKNEPPTCVVHPIPHRGDFTTITEAIRKSEPGTKIIVKPGLYQEDLIIDKPLEIVGDGERSDIVLQVPTAYVISFRTILGRVANLTLRQTGKKAGTTVDINQGRLELEDCDITSQGGIGVLIRNGADPRLRRNRIHDSESSGVLVHLSGQGTLEDNDIFGNNLSGITVRDCSCPVVRNNRIVKNRGFGIIVSEAGGTFEGNDVRDNAWGAWSIDPSSEAKVKLADNQE